MNLSVLRDPQRRSVCIVKVTKTVKRIVAQPAESRPIFVFGKQRSGTTMLMTVLNLHPDTEIFGEGPNNKAFKDCRIRGFDVLERLIAESRARFVCFKPIADSHLMGDFLRHFPDGRYVWLYRSYGDTARSSLKRFPHATAAIKKVCMGEGGGGWFQEGVSAASIRTLKEIYTLDMTDYDLACLVWWARNRIFTELQLQAVPSMLLEKYENLTTRPDESFGALFKFLGMSNYKRAIQFIHTSERSQVRTDVLHPDVRVLCDALTVELEQCLNQPRSHGY